MGGAEGTTAGSGRAWDSALPVGDFAAIRGVGFEPVGQVFGAAVYYLGTVLGAGCPGTSADSLLRDTQPGPDANAAPGPGRVLGIAGPAAKVARGLYDGRRTAIDRMTSQCAELGGHGIVGAAVRVREIPPDGLTAGALEFTVVGTAIWASGCPPLRRPFATDLSGPDFVKLIMAGWVPPAIATGISVAGLHDDSPSTRPGPWRTGNAEVPAYTALLIKVRQDARRRLEHEIRAVGADGIAASAITLRVRSDPCHAYPGGTDYLAEAVITGTAIARFSGPRESALSGLAVIHLDPPLSR